MPFLIKYVGEGIKEMAIRFSEFEPIELARKFYGKVNWIWVDCFTDLPLDDNNYYELKKHFKICLVSPELISHPLEKIGLFKNRLKDKEIDASL